MVYFSIKYIHIKKTFNRCLIFFYFSAVFEKSANISYQESSITHILKECLIFKDLQIFRKKTGTICSTFIHVAPLKILKRYRNTSGTELAKYNTLRQTATTKQGSNFTSLVPLIFPREFHVLLFNFSHTYFFDRTCIKQMIGSSHSQLSKKISFSVKLQDGALEKCLRRISLLINFRISYLVNCTEN